MLEMLEMAKNAPSGARGHPRLIIWQQLNVGEQPLWCAGGGYHNHPSTLTTGGTTQCVGAQADIGFQVAFQA